MAININLKKLLKERGYTIVKLSNEIDITPANLSKIINNRVSEIKLETLNRICEILRCTPGEILEYNCQIKKKIIPFFIDYVGGTDDLLSEGVENFKKFLKFIKDFQDINNIEIKIILITGLHFTSAKSRYNLLKKLAESFNLPDLIYGTSIEYSGFFMKGENATQLMPLDTRIFEKKIDIEIIANQYNSEISTQYSSIYNLFFRDPISRSKLSEICEKLDNIINCDEIETVPYFDKYGCEIDIRNKNNSKSNAILNIFDKLKIEYDIPIVVIGGAPLKVNWEMYSNSKDKLNKKGFNTLYFITTDFEKAKEIDRDDKNIICLDLKDFSNISRLFLEINSRINYNRS